MAIAAGKEGGVVLVRKRGEEQKKMDEGSIRIRGASQQVSIEV